MRAEVRKKVMSEYQCVWIDGERCSGCGSCVDECPVGAIVLADGIARVDPEMCTTCGACLEICPEDAIHPVIRGELVPAEDRTALSPARQATLAQQPSRPLVERAAPAVAVVGAGLVAKMTRALAQAVGRWLTESGEDTGLSVRDRTPTSRSGRTNGGGRRRRRRRRGR